MAMAILIIGLILFLGTHSTRMLVPGWRQAQLDRFGEKGWKGGVALTSLAGFILLITGYALAHPEQTPLWHTPQLLDPLIGTLLLFAFVLMAAAFIRGSQIAARVGHPLVAGIGLWALAHLVATGGRPADWLLFGLFTLWAFSSLISLRRRDRAAGVVASNGRLAMDGAAVGAGLMLYLAFVFFLHQLLFGVPAFGG